VSAYPKRSLQTAQHGLRARRQVKDHAIRMSGFSKMIPVSVSELFIITNAAAR
jgi:hypothetical protein